VLFVADLLFEVGDAVAKEKLKPRRAEERGDEAVGGGVGSFVGGVFGCALDGEEIGIAKDEEFGVGCEWEKLGEGFRFFFAEVVEVGFPGGGSGVVGSLNGFWVVIGILHVVGENHDLGGIDKAAELGVLESAVNSFPLGKDAIAIVRLFDFDEGKWNAVDEESDVGAEFFVTVLAGELGDDVEESRRR
jgi:hypothetical protein